MMVLDDEGLQAVGVGAGERSRCCCDNGDDDDTGRAVDCRGEMWWARGFLLVGGNNIMFLRDVGW